VHHPHNDEALLVRGCQLLVLVIPLNHLDLTGVALKRLVHAEITATLSFATVKLEDLKQALISTHSNVTFFLVPCHHIHWRLDANLYSNSNYLFEKMHKFERSKEKTINMAVHNTIASASRCPTKPLTFLLKYANIVFQELSTDFFIYCMKV